MTKEQILQKHFTAEFGHDGHGEFMQYIKNAMEEYAQQQVKNLNIPAVIKSVCENCSNTDFNETMGCRNYLQGFKCENFKQTGL
jgi:hypothetical protein